LRVLLYSVAELVVSSRVLPCPPGSGIAWHSCDLHDWTPAVSRRVDLIRLTQPIAYPTLVPADW